VAQKKDIKRQKERLEALKKESEQEKVKAKQAARERVLADFEKGQLGLAAASAAVTTSGAEVTGDESLISFTPL
jgi:nitric oxide synthase-interacting protein